jgi:hypothetical protein
LGGPDASVRNAIVLADGLTNSSVSCFFCFWVASFLPEKTHQRSIRRVGTRLLDYSTFEEFVNNLIVEKLSPNLTEQCINSADHAIETSRQLAEERRLGNPKNTPA